VYLREHIKRGKELYVEMQLSEANLMEEDWDVAVILDACRYDYFKTFYRYYFEGELRRVLSKGSCTPEWFRKTFTSKYNDVVYVSANPFINSSPYVIKGCCAKKHFYKVIDVWAKHWDSELGTVLPKNVNRYLLKILDRYKGKRIIVHYLQPHAPYLSPKYFVIGFNLPDVSKGFVFVPLLPYTFSHKSQRKAILKGNKWFLHKLEVLSCWCERIAKKTILGNGFILKLWEVLGMPPRSPLDATRRLYGIKGLRNAYITNLLIVLETLTYVLEKIDGNIIITSDHGEFLGERNMYRHPCGISDPILRHVPYFIVNKVKKPTKPMFSLYPLKLKLKLMRRFSQKN